MSRKVAYPASGWLPPGAHLEFMQDDQGKDFVTNWKGQVQAPGRGRCINILHDKPFPNGFGPNYPVVRMETGPFAGHDWYLGHCTSRVRVGQRFDFGHVLAVADQGRNWANTQGGWVELGEAPGGFPGHKSTTHWFDHLLAKPVVHKVPDPPLRRGDKGWRVLGLTINLTLCGYLSFPTWAYGEKVAAAVHRFDRRHQLKHESFGVSDKLYVQIKHSAQWCRKHHKKEV